MCYPHVPARTYMSVCIYIYIIRIYLCVRIEHMYKRMWPCTVVIERERRTLAETRRSNQHSERERERVSGRDMREIEIEIEIGIERERQREKECVCVCLCVCVSVCVCVCVCACACACARVCPAALSSRHCKRCCLYSPRVACAEPKEQHGTTPCPSIPNVC